MKIMKIVMLVDHHQGGLTCHLTPSQDRFTRFALANPENRRRIVGVLQLRDGSARLLDEAGDHACHTNLSIMRRSASSSRIYPDRWLLTGTSALTSPTVKPSRNHTPYAAPPMKSEPWVFNDGSRTPHSAPLLKSQPCLNH
jgi:hypothetical protein